MNPLPTATRPADPTAAALAGKRAARACLVEDLGPGPDPESVFRVLADRPGVFYLDSAGSLLAAPDAADAEASRLHERTHGRWSFLGAEPFLVIESDGPKVVEIAPPSASRRERRANPFDMLREVMARFRSDPGERAMPFTSGAVGYFGYDLKHAVERLPRRAARDQAFPDMHLGLYEAVLAHDGRDGRWYATAAPWAAPDGRARLDALRDALAEAGRRPAGSRGGPAPSAHRLLPNMTRARYLGAVERILEYIAAGDIFQANFAQRFETTVAGPACEVYLRLRRRNPAPFAAYLDLGDGRAVLSSSPEQFLVKRGRDVETRPIKGTRPRGATPAQDRASMDDLLASEKDAAELAMIVDLERNDLGRVADYGSVRVAERRALESYPTVHHLVATVTGRLAEDRDEVDLLRATLPGGSITGAPKIRSMEIIEELEPTARSVYTGAMGYVDFSGDLGLNIAIRTMLYDAGRVTYQVGGGIVADSDPEAEYAECMDKGLALAEALGGRAEALGEGA